jgi:hypothetical protein
MRLFLFSIISLISLSLNAQKQHYGLLDKDITYELKNKELTVNVKVYIQNKVLKLESNFCPECNDTRYYEIKNIKKLKGDHYFFYIEKYYFVIDLSKLQPSLYLVNSFIHGIQDPLLEYERYSMN